MLLVYYKISFNSGDYNNMIIMNVETWNYLKIKILMDRREKLENLMSVDAIVITLVCIKMKSNPSLRIPYGDVVGFITTRV